MYGIISYPRKRLEMCPMRLQLTLKQGLPQEAGQLTPRPLVAGRKNHFFEYVTFLVQNFAAKINLQQWL